jgi:Glyoxalase-like domain
MSSSDDSNNSDGDNKMKKLLDDWDSDEDDNGSKYVDSDSDSDDGKSNNTKDKSKAVVPKKGSLGTSNNNNKKQSSSKKSTVPVSESESDDESSGPNVHDDSDSSSNNNSSYNENDNDNSESSSKSDDDDDDNDNASSSSSSSSSNSSSGDDGSDDDVKSMEDDDDDDDDKATEEEVEEEAKVVKVEEKKPKTSTKITRDVVPSKDGSDNSDEVDDDDDDDCGAEAVVDKFKKKPKVKKENIKVQKLTEVTDDDDPEAAEMKKILAGWDNDDDKDSDDNNSSLNSSDDDDSEDPSEREIELDDHVLDHIVLAARDLDEAMSTFETMSGVRPIVAGTIKGLGIKCARVSFSDATYLEIIAPDPESPGPIGQLLLRQSKNMANNELIPFHYAIRSTRADKLKDEVKKFGYVPDHISMFGTKKDGTPRKWELLFLYKHNMGGLCPFVINWANSEHPCTTLPIVGKLKKFTVRFPEDDPAHTLLNHINVNGILSVEVGKPKLSFQFSSPEGTVKFAATKATGFKFPGFDDDEADIEDDDDVSFEAPKAPELLDVADDSY